MSVEFFEENDSQYNKSSAQSIMNKPKGITGMFIKIGLAKSKSGAEMIILIITIALFLISFFFLFLGNTTVADVNPEVEDLLRDLESQGYTGPEVLIEMSERLSQQ